MFTPYELRRVKHEHLVDATHGFWKRVGDRVAVRPARTLIGAIAVLLLMCLGLTFFSTDLTTNDGYRTTVESVEGQELLAKWFPAGSSAPTDIIVATPPTSRRCAPRSPGRRREAVSPPVAQGEDGRVLLQATLVPPPYSTEAST